MENLVKKSKTELSDRDHQIHICFNYVFGVFSIIDDPAIKENMEMICVYMATRFVNTHPMIHDGLSNDMVLKYFDSFLNDRLDTIMEFLKIINSAVLISEGEA